MSKSSSGDQSSKNTQVRTERHGGEFADSSDKEKFKLFRVQFNEPVGNMQYAGPELVEEIDDNAGIVIIKSDVNRYVVPMNNIRYIHFRAAEK